MWVWSDNRSVFKILLSFLQTPGAIAVQSITPEHHHYQPQQQQQRQQTEDPQSKIKQDAQVSPSAEATPTLTQPPLLCRAQVFPSLTLYHLTPAPLPASQQITPKPLKETFPLNAR